MKMIERYRRWFEYEQDSHAKTIASLNAVAPALRATEQFSKALYLMGHLIAARRIWLFRLGFLKENAELFPETPELAALPGQLSEIESLWVTYLNGLTEADLERVFEYRSYEGRMFRDSVEDILTQMFGHSWYHRGQIAMLLRSI